MFPIMRIAAAAALMTAGAALAQTATTPSTAPAPAPKPTPAIKRICRFEAQTGSIMPPRRTCRTKEDWSAIDKTAASSANSLLQQREHGSMGAQGY